MRALLSAFPCRAQSSRMISAKHGLVESDCRTGIVFFSAISVHRRVENFGARVENSGGCGWKIFGDNSQQGGNFRSFGGARWKNETVTGGGSMCGN